PTTVKTHISSILAKIGARARVQAVVLPARSRRHPGGSGQEYQVGSGSSPSRTQRPTSRRL
ncbi:LuxR C-terminal-related transcriptional regulator, partial [Streptomyces sp. NPDC000878]